MRKERPPVESRRGAVAVGFNPGCKDHRAVRGTCHPASHVGFIVTNLSRPAERVVALYNQRGKAEQYITEGKNAIKWTRLSCRKFRDNAVRLQLHALAYSFANFMRTLALPKEVEHWSVTTLRA